MKFNRKQSLAALAVGAVALAGTGIGYAVWNSPNGSGDGHATGYQSVKADVTSQSTNTNATDATSLYPGSSVTNTVTITNPNPYPIKVTAITGDAPGSAADGSCSAGRVTATDQSVAAGIAQTNTSVPIAGHGTGIYNVVFTMNSAAENACQGVSFVVPLTVASQSSSF